MRRISHQYPLHAVMRKHGCELSNFAASSQVEVLNTISDYIPDPDLWSTSIKTSTVDAFRVV